MNTRKFTLKELSQAVGRLQSLHTLPIHCEVCERNRPIELIVVTSTFIPVGVCLMCGTSLIAHDAKRRTPSLATVGTNGRSETSNHTTRVRNGKAKK